MSNTKSSYVQVRFSGGEHSCLQEIQELLFVKSFSDTIRDFIEQSMRIQMRTDCHWPLSYSLCETTGQALYQLYVDWLKAKAGHSGYFFRMVSEMDETRCIVITPGQKRVKAVDYERSQRETLKNGGYSDDEVNEIIETLKESYGEMVAIVADDADDTEV